MVKEERIKELKLQIAEKKASIALHKKNADQANAMQLALKIVMNGAYGALAAKHFVLFCNGVAGTITAHGRDLIIRMNDVNEEYWYEKFHLDTELHEKVAIFSEVLQYIEDNGLSKYRKIGKNDVFIVNDHERIEEIKGLINLDNLIIPNIDKLDNSWVHADSRKVIDEPTKVDIYKTGDAVRKVPVSVYADTDSVFVGMKPAIQAYDWKHEPLDLVLYISEVRLEGVLKESLDNYAKKYGVENLEDFELEQVSKSVIWLEKKMYVKNVVWDEGVFSDGESNIQAKGIDLVRSSSPAFTRQHVYDILKYFFENPETMNDKELVRLVKEIKDLFILAPIEDISVSSSCNKYDEKIIDDQDSLRYVSGTHVSVKAAGFHNYLLNKNSEFKQQYDTIKSGQKVKMYFTNSMVNDRFAYVGGNFPKELAMKHAPIDYDKQFEVAILKLINRFCNVLNLSELTPKLKFTVSLF
jgi:DNA polymerase elongation subunit (family B)